MDWIISVLLVDREQALNKVSHRASWASFLAHASQDSGETRLRLRCARDLDEAMTCLREERIDAILLDRCEAPGIAAMHACAPDVPILAFADDSSGKAIHLAVSEGAQDILIPSDLASTPDFLRRLDLAIARKVFELRRVRNTRRDELTGLANSALLEERFLRALARADRFGTLIGLVAIDIDGFDALVARHGQSITDRLLSMVGQRYASETRQTDTLARTRAHGFTWLVEGLPTIDDINALVNRLPGQLSQPFSIGSQTIRLTASVGLAISPCHGRSFQTVHGLAEAAMLDVSTISGDALLMHPVSPEPLPKGMKATTGTASV